MYFNFLFFVNCIRLKKKYYFLDIRNPITFNEKIISTININRLNKSFFADKLNLPLVLSKYNIEIKTPKVLAILNTEKELLDFNFKQLEPMGFVIKANHGSGLNMIFNSGNSPSIREISKINSWFTYDSSINSRETHYNLIAKKVFIEELLDSNIQDYKFHCYNGKVEFIQIDVDRFIEHRRNIYDRNWNLQNFELNYAKTYYEIDKPENLDEMLQLAEKISNLAIFDNYLRVDFYLNRNVIYLGELTFHPGGGVEPFDSYESDLYMGSFF